MICPFLSSGTVTGVIEDLQPCITTCALRIGNKCSFNVLAQKAVLETRKIQKENVNKDQ